MLTQSPYRLALPYAEMGAFRVVLTMLNLAANVRGLARSEFEYADLFGQDC